MPTATQDSRGIHAAIQAGVSGRDSRRDSRRIHAGGFTQDSRRRIHAGFTQADSRRIHAGGCSICFYCNLPKNRGRPLFPLNSPIDVFPVSRSGHSKGNYIGSHESK